jgi:hypothetical protein
MYIFDTYLIDVIISVLGRALTIDGKNMNTLVQ